ncbi:MAG: hypothetical protein KGL39_51495 [Patescibacteria group bacterium]|nr:hypothetical protein [Patescibacteria group bacterium]
MIDAARDSSAMMSLWFVYSDETYYPCAKIIEAETAEAAAAAFENYNIERKLLVFPWDALALRVEPDDD